MQRGKLYQHPADAAGGVDGRLPGGDRRRGEGGGEQAGRETGHRNGHS